MTEKILKKIEGKKKELQEKTARIKLHLNNLQRHEAEANKIQQEILGLQGEIKALQEVLDEKEKDQTIPK